MPEQLPLFYSKIAVLNKFTHKELSVAPVTNFSFASRANNVLLAGIEFPEAAKEYPILFVTSPNQKKVPVALLGPRKDENLYVGPDGKWNAKYIPAYVRRYPFIMADDGAGSLTLCFEESYAGLNTAGGKPVFDSSSEATDWLKGILGFMQQYQADFLRTDAFISRLEALGLFKEMSARMVLNDGSESNLNGFWVVDEQKLLEMDKEAQYELFKSGELGWIYAHLISLSNFNRQVEMIAAKNPVSLQQRVMVNTT